MTRLKVLCFRGTICLVLSSHASCANTIITVCAIVRRISWWPSPVVVNAWTSGRASWPCRCICYGLAFQQESFVLLLLIGLRSSSGFGDDVRPSFIIWDSCYENGWGRVLSFRVVWHLILGFSPHTDSDVCAVMARLQSTFPRCMKTSHLGLSDLCWTCVAAITHLPCTFFFAAASPFHGSGVPFSEGTWTAGICLDNGPAVDIE